MSTPRTAEVPHAHHSLSIAFLPQVRSYSILDKDEDQKQEENVHVQSINSLTRRKTNIYIIGFLWVLFRLSTDLEMKTIKIGLVIKLVSGRHHAKFKCYHLECSAGGK